MLTAQLKNYKGTFLFKYQMSNDAKSITIHARTKLSLASAKLSQAYYYQSLPFCIIDSIFSLGVKYGQVEKAVNHFSTRSQWPTFREFESDFPKQDNQKKVSEFLDLFSKTKSPEIDLFCNRCYANPRARSGRILKAVLVGQFAEVLKSEKIETFQDLTAYDNYEALDNMISCLPALKSKVAIRYFRMLAGDDQQVKPDRMILRFIADAIGKNVDPDDAALLIQDACDILKRTFPTLTPRLLDHEIWKYQRTK